MAGTATNYDVTRVHQGPGDLWIIGGGVADSATPQLTLATDGTPDATAHPASVHFGLFESAAGLAFTPKPDDIMADQFDGPIARYNTELKLGIEAELKQLDPVIMQNAMPWATYAAASGYRQLTFGGLLIMGAGLCVATIAKKRGASGKYIVCILFAAHGKAAVQTSIGKTKASNWKVQFEALTDPTRTAGRQQGIFYETL